MTTKKNLPIVPLSDRVLIKAEAQEKVTASGIVLPDTVQKEKPKRGQVLAVGSGRISDTGTVIPPSIAVGDTVYFSQYAPEEISWNGEEYLILREDAVLAVVKE